jgi:hypothetical protein
MTVDNFEEAKDRRRDQSLNRWKRFDRLQRTILLNSPKGVFRFRTYEEFNAWKDFRQQ